MQYHQVRILCALRDKIWNADKSLTGHQAMDRARARMTRLGSGSRELFDLKRGFTLAGGNEAVVAVHF
jgi:hypothetical protein